MRARRGRIPDGKFRVAALTRGGANCRAERCRLPLILRRNADLELVSGVAVERDVAVLVGEGKEKRGVKP